MAKVVDNYVLEDEIGKSQFIQMFKSKHIITKDYTVIKVLRLEIYKRYPMLQQMITEEVQALKILDSPFIIKSLRFLRTTNNMYQVYEYFPSGTLKSLLQQKYFLEEHHALKLFKDMVQGVRSLNDKNIIHQNLKPSNIFLRNGTAVIGDFSCCKILSSKRDQILGSNGYLTYQAPEILRNEPHDIRSDLFSLGVILYEMLYGQKPYKSINAKELLIEMHCGL